MSAPSQRDMGTAAHAVLHQCLVSIYQWGLPTRAANYSGVIFDVEDEPHEPLSPSGAKQWMNCAASFPMQKEHPEPDPPEQVRKVAVDAEHIAAVQMCLDYVAMRVQQLKQQSPGAVIEVASELAVSPGAAFPGGDRRFDGTLDIAILVYKSGPVVYAEVVDFKAGAAVQVEPEDPQLDQYLLGLCAQRHTGMKSARLTVVQPRNFRLKEKIRWREVPSIRMWMGEHVNQVIAAKKRIDETPDLFSPSPETCSGCSAKGVCMASYSYALDKTGVLPEGAALPESANDMYALLQEGAARDTRSLSGEQLRGILDGREMLKGALQASEAWALDQMMKGSAPAPVVEYYKLVAGRGSRKWGPGEEEALKRLRRIKVQSPGDEKMRALGKKELTETRLKSVAQVENVLKTYSIPRTDARWAAFQALVDHASGALTIAPRSDPRDEVKPLRRSPDEAFDPETAPEGGAEQKTT